MNAENVNIPLLRKAVEWAETEAAKPPELCEWRQAFWVTPATDDDRTGWGVWAHPTETTANAGRSTDCGTCYCIAGYIVATQVGPVSRDLDTLAAEILGLTEVEAAPLFAATNSIEDVRRIAEEIAGERL